MIEMASDKRCAKCGQVKPVEGFNKASRAKDGLRSWCKVCTNFAKAEYRKSHYEELLEAGTRYRQAHRKEDAARSGAYRKAHREELAEKAHLYCLTHPKETAEQRHVYRQAHRKELTEKWRAYCLPHREEMAKYRTAYREKNSERIRAKNARRRALKLAATVEFISPATVYARDAGRCHICGKKVDPKKWHMDHLIPLSRGGEHSYRNVAVAHPLCNNRRYNNGPAQLLLIG